MLCDFGRPPSMLGMPCCDKQAPNCLVSAYAWGMLWSVGLDPLGLGHSCVCLWLLFPKGLLEWLAIQAGAILGPGSVRVISLHVVAAAAVLLMWQHGHVAALPRGNHSTVTAAVAAACY